MRATFIFGKVFPCWPFLLSEVAKGKTDKQSRTQCAQQIGFTPFFRFRDIYPDPLFVLIIQVLFVGLALPISQHAFIILASGKSTTRIRLRNITVKLCLVFLLTSPRFLWSQHGSIYPLVESSVLWHTNVSKLFGWFRIVIGKLWKKVKCMIWGYWSLKFIVKCDLIKPFRFQSEC